MKKISDLISYLPAEEVPLSADVGVVQGERFCWIYDVGNSEKAAEMLLGIKQEKNIVISHFHQDHMGNLDRISYAGLYCGSYTRRKVPDGIEIREPVSLEDGIRLTLFPIPSVHAKGCVGLEVDETFAFLGDAVYGCRKNGRPVYNASLLQETILALKKTKAKYFLVSHEEEFQKPRELVLERLQKIYEKRRPGEVYIYMDENPDIG